MPVCMSIMRHDVHNFKQFIMYSVGLAHLDLVVVVVAVAVRCVVDVLR